MRSTVNVTIVPSTSAIGAGSIVVGCAPPADTRAGGRCTTPVSRSCEPTNPNFQSSLRAAAEAETRCGSGRRGGSTGTCRATTRNLPYGTRRAGGDLRGDRSAPAGTTRARRWRGTAARRRRRRAPRARCTWPGSACSSSDGQQQPGLRGAGVADDRARGRRSRATPSSLPPTRARDPLACGATDAAAATSSAVSAGRLERRVPRLLAERHVLISPNAPPTTLVRCSPGARQRSTNSSVTLAAPRSSATTGPAASEPTTNAAAPSPPAGSSALPGRPVRMSPVTTSAASAEPSSASAARPRPSGPTRRSRRGRGVGEAERGVDGGGVGLVEVGRVRWWRTSTASGTSVAAARARGGPPRRPSWWCPRRRTPPCGFPCRRPAPNGGDLRAVEPPVGQVGRPATMIPRMTCRVPARERPDGASACEWVPCSRPATKGEHGAARRRGERGRGDVRQAARRRARARARADAGAARTRPSCWRGSAPTS